jgi:mitogen-activated protein kinase binding protein 1
LWYSYDEQNARVSVVYNDHSLYIWDVRDVRKVGKSHSFLFHSACIWGLEVGLYRMFLKISRKIFI